jgi:ElaB/YqjD/DUF883 family membrane-anchored ribosome-binding protein
MFVVSVFARRRMMTQESLTTERETADVEHQIKETRSHLAEQVEALEHHVGDMVHDATTAVSATIESVKETVGKTVDTVQEAVKGTVSSVKHALDLGGHIRRHPWLMLAGAVALGYVCGNLFLRRR